MTKCCVLTCVSSPVQESRIEELRDTHRLEGASQTELITKLRLQLSTAETNLSTKAGDLMAMSQLRTDLSKAQTQAKEEEEKRTKAISLLKTVRAKLVKVEREKEEVEKDRAAERAERSKANDEVEKVKAEREREANNLRKGFDRELASLKERGEKDLAQKKGAWELEMITTKVGRVYSLERDPLLTLSAGGARQGAVTQGCQGHRPGGERQGATDDQGDAV